MARVVIFGNGQTAELTLARIRRDTDHVAVGFTVDRNFIQSQTLHDLPVVPFDEVVKHWSPEHHSMLIAVGPTHVNRIRSERFRAAREMGYPFISLISPRADVWPGVEIGDNCIIGDGCSVLPFSRIGDDVHLSSGCIVSHHCTIGDHGFLGPGVVIAGSVTIESHVFLGAGAVLRDGITVRESSLIGAGVVLNCDTKPSSVFAAPAATPLPISSDRLPSSIRPRQAPPSSNDG
jgi:sugar O-acyltransferase (sialic acid O-acetyltransferase NeuD family)